MKVYIGGATDSDALKPDGVRIGSSCMRFTMIVEMPEVGEDDDDGPLAINVPFPVSGTTASCLLRFLGPDAALLQQQHLPFAGEALRLADFLGADADLTDLIVEAFVVRATSEAGAAEIEALAPETQRAMLDDWLDMRRLVKEPHAAGLLRTLDAMCSAVHDVARRLQDAILRPPPPRGGKRSAKRKRADAAAADEAEAAAKAWAAPLLDGFVELAEGVPADQRPHARLMEVARAASRETFVAFAKRLHTAGLPAKDVVLAAVRPTGKSEPAALDMLDALKRLGPTWNVNLSLQNKTLVELLQAGNFRVLGALLTPELDALDEFYLALDAIKGHEAAPTLLVGLIRMFRDDFGKDVLEFGSRFAEAFAWAADRRVIRKLLEIVHERDGNLFTRYLEYLFRSGGAGE